MSRVKKISLLALVVVVISGGWFANNLHVERNRQEQREADQHKRAQQTKNIEKISETELTKNEHPLDSVLLLARDSLNYISENITDYTATLTRQERIGDILTEKNISRVKIRNELENQPLSVYILFTQPTGVRGREVIWVAGENENKITAHEGGLLNLFRVIQPHDGFVAMMGSRYSIAETGIQRLMATLIQHALHDRKYGECEVQLSEVQSGGVACRRIRVVHPIEREHFIFHVVEVDIDLQHNIPVRLASWMWPETDGGDPPLTEEYIYTDIKLNVGLTNDDFNPDSEQYNYPD
jgi:cell division protein FtsB